MNRVANIAVCTVIIFAASHVASRAQPETKGALPVKNPKVTAIIDYIHGFPHHKDGHGGGGPSGGGGGGGGGGGDSHSNGHYELIGGVWPDFTAGGPVDASLLFVVDLRGFPPGSQAAIEAGFNVWETQTDGELLAGLVYADVVVDFEDGVNTYSMRNLGGGGVLAVTFFSWDDTNNDGAINNGEQFLEVDIVHNSTIKWATDSFKPPGPMWWDVQAIAAHEIGHAYGIAHPGTAHERDKEQTMYASAPARETKKRTLENDGDIPGIRDPFLGYGAP